MKIVVTCRTRNEQANINRFCQSYSWADEILIADGGSEDRTIELATKYSNVSVKSFDEKVLGNNNLWRNPHGKHLNFLYEWAEDIGADWIIHDDCDCVPTKSFQKDAKNIFEKSNADCIMLQRLYVYKTLHYFPEMTTGHFMYAWRKSVQIRASEDDPWKHEVKIPKNSLRQCLDFPYVVLHYFAQTDTQIKRKLHFYVESGQHPSMQHPLEFGGQLKKLPEWGVWK